MDRVPEWPDGRIDGVEKVTGAAKYTTDLKVPGMLHGKILRSTLPHGRIVRIDAARAMAMPGVVAVLTGDDVRDIDPYYGIFYRDRPLVAIDRVRYVGDPVAAVAAVDEYTALEALEAIDVEYDDLPFVTAADEALKPDAPLVHDAPRLQMDDFYFRGRANPVPGTNICHRYVYEHGDPDRAFAEADRVFEDVFTFPAVSHFALEAHCTIAAFHEDGLTVWSAAQAPFAVRRTLAQLFGLPQGKVRVIVPYVGGGFGGKSSVRIEPLVTALARKARQPVRVALSAQESMLTCRRLSARIRIRTGVKRDGTIVAKECRLVLDTGAYADSGPGVATKSAIRSIGPYRVPNLRLESLAVYTNTIPGASFRAIGGPQAVWATESQMDIIAEALDLDPVEFRLKNLVRKGEAIRPDLRALDVDLTDGLRTVAKEVGTPRRQAGLVLAGGVAMAASDPASMSLASAIVRLLSDGSAIVLASSIELGQGIRTVLARIVAGELGLPPASVSVVTPDTTVTPHDWLTGASRSTTIMGLAVLEAVGDIRRKLAAMAAEACGMAPELVRVGDGAVTDGARRLSFAELFHQYFGIRDGEVLGTAQLSARSFGGRLAQAPLFWETVVAGCGIAVDPETGAIRLTSYTSVTEVGRALNPQMCEGQEEGAAVQGLGHTLYEELRYEDGQPVNATPVDYHVPTIDQVPEDFTTILLEDGEGPGPYGSRGMGEGGILPTAPAIANALSHALGIRVHDLPLTPERVWRALNARPGGPAGSGDR